VKVCFEGVGTVSLRRETWIKCNRGGEKIGNITQFPIILAYAVTCHRSQALTLPAVVLHCSKEFVPGLLYVAMSKVTLSVGNVKFVTSVFPYPVQKFVV